MRVTALLVLFSLIGPAAFADWATPAGMLYMNLVQSRQGPCPAGQSPVITDRANMATGLGLEVAMMAPIGRGFRVGGRVGNYLRMLRQGHRAGSDHAAGMVVGVTQDMAALDARAFAQLGDDIARAQRGLGVHSEYVDDLAVLYRYTQKHGPVAYGPAGSGRMASLSASGANRALDVGMRDGAAELADFGVRGTLGAYAMVFPGVHCAKPDEVEKVKELAEEEKEKQKQKILDDPPTPAPGPAPPPIPIGGVGGGPQGPTGPIGGQPGWIQPGSGIQIEITLSPIGGASVTTEEHFNWGGMKTCHVGGGQGTVEVPAWAPCPF